MSDLLREAMRDLGGQGRLEHSQVELARITWAAGRRRRVRSRAAVVGACVAVLGLLGLALPLLRSVPIRPAAPSSRTVPSYPEYIGTSRPTAVLPGRPGSIAGVLQDVTFGDEVTYYAVTATGVRWRIPASDGAMPSVSPDGRLLLTVVPKLGGLQVHDLLQGTTWIVPGQQSAGSTPDEWVYWAPDDNTHMLSSRARRLLDLRTGRVVRLPTTGITAGLARGNRAVTVSYHAPRDQDMTDVEAHVVDLSTGAVRDVPLRPTRPYVGLPVQQGEAVVSPDGSTLVIATHPDYPTYDLDYYSLATGRQIETRHATYVRDGSIGLSWGKGLVLPVSGGNDTSDGRTVEATADGPKTLVLAKVRGESTTPTMRWAADAISGTPYRTPSGTVAVWWSSWGNWALIATASLIAAAGWFLIFRGYRNWHF